MEAYHDMYSYFSSGDIFRALLSSDNAIGKYIKERMNKWDLINDNVTNSLLLAYFHTILDDGKHMLLDGYPRTINQLDDIFRISDQYKRTMMWIQFVVPDEVVMQRMLDRGRTDDTPEAIQHRIDQYYSKTVPVITYFSQHCRLVKIDANRPIQEIHTEVKRIVNA